MDEKIIEMRKAKNKPTSLDDRLYIKGEFVEFEPTKLFNDSLEIMLPKTFVDMPKRIAAIKYPSENR